MARQISRGSIGKRDPLKGSRLKGFKQTWKNPYIGEIINYLKEEVFKRFYRAMEPITPHGTNLEYIFMDDQPWYVISPGTLQIFETGMVFSDPELITGGKIWFRVVVGDRETNRGICVEWNDKVLRTDIDAMELATLCRQPMWNEKPSMVYSTPPNGLVLGQSQGSDEPLESKFYTELADHCKNALKRMGSKGNDIDPDKLARVVGYWSKQAEKKGEVTNTIIGRTVTDYFQQ